MAKEHARFNSYKHIDVTLDEANETVSILTKGGKRITICVMEKARCLDIQYHDSGRGEHDIPLFDIMGFRFGNTPVTRTEVTLATILL